MAGVWVATPDETTEINFWDYGRNVAGFLDDRDAWTGDFWAASANRNRRAQGIPSSGDNAEGGVQLAFRSFSRALGVEASLTDSNVEDGIGTEFERHSFGGPTVSVVANQAFGGDDAGVGSLVLGGALSVVNETDDVNATNQLAVAHDTDRIDYQFGAVYIPTSTISVGASLSLSDNSLSGLSESGLHRDRYTWDRPITEFGGQVLFERGRLQGGAFVHRSILDGGELLNVSWAREFALNPSGVDLELRVPILDEERKQTTFGTRWRVGLSNRLLAGASVEIVSGTYDAIANPTWSSFQGTTSDEFDRTEISLGIAARPIPRLLASAQLDVITGELIEEALETLTTTDDEASTFRAGLEYLWVSDLVLRGGVAIGTETLDVSDTIGMTSNEFDRVLYSGGVGWLPRGGVFAVDLAFGFTDVEASSPSDLVDTTDGLSFSLSGRTLFR